MTNGVNRTYKCQKLDYHISSRASDCDIRTMIMKGIKMERRIKRNRLQCKLCGDIIESKYTHDYVMCSCKKCAIDGGKEYVRFSAPSPDDVILLTEYEDDNQNLHT